MRKVIVSLILIRDGKILVAERTSKRKLDPGKVLFPGGHVQKGETLKDAIIREAKEELSIDLIDPYEIYSTDFNTVGEKQHIHWFACENFKRKIEPSEAERLFWIDPLDSDILSYQASRDALNVLLGQGLHRG